MKAEAEREEGDRLAGAPHPRTRHALVGHEAAQAEVLAAWNAGRLPHAFLIGGPEGIGKATLAYKIARFVLAQRERGVNTLGIPPDHPAARQVAALSHPDFLVLRRIAEEEKKLPTEIKVEEVRKLVKFFGTTAASGGYRVCIIDSLDELNKSGANALLKVLEEPPSRSLFLLISHSPGRLLATIRSRCQRAALRPLATEEVMRALQSLAPEIENLPADRIPEAAVASGGSVRHALSLLMGQGLEVRGMTEKLLAELPSPDGERLHKLGDSLRDREGFYIFAETVEDWLASAATQRGAPPARLARFAETWENVRRAGIETDAFGLDRKPFVFKVFSMLADVTR
ncbi:MAG TPA: DNA polymerase III subunit delta' [Xanthobacteraceae bacterium]|nr:DNA polymerase III subunit delta' [Xanthobacteraceae bacterium]